MPPRATPPGEEPTDGGGPRLRTGLLTATLLLVAAVVLHSIHFDPQDPGLAGNTRSVLHELVAGQDARDNHRPALEVLDSLPTPEAGRRLIVWVGNSHQHAVNSWQPGDTVSSVYLHRMLNGEQWPGRTPVFGISYPNLTCEEQFLIALALELPAAHVTRPALLIEGVRFHDARELGIRAELRPLLRLPRVREWIHAERSAEFAEAFAQLDRSLAEADAEDENERGVEPWLMSNVGPFIYYASLQALTDSRNWAFGIDTRTKRPILPQRYTLSLQFLELMLQVARSNGTQVLLYNVPLRQEVMNPYVPDQYGRFRQDLAAIAARRGALFEDYDSLIPTELWGTWYKTAYPDFSHFTAAGHRLLAERVRSDIAPLLGAASTSPPPPGESDHALQ